MNVKKVKKLFQTDIVALKISRFFAKNPASVDSVGGIAAWVNSERSDVEKSLEKLLDVGVLEADSSGAMRGFSLPDDKDAIKTIQDIVKNV